MAAKLSSIFRLKQNITAYLDDIYDSLPQKGF